MAGSKKKFAAFSSMDAYKSPSSAAAAVTGGSSSSAWVVKQALPSQMGTNCTYRGSSISHNTPHMSTSLYDTAPNSQDVYGAAAGAAVSAAHGSPVKNKEMLRPQHIASREEPLLNVKDGEDDTLEYPGDTDSEEEEPALQYSTGADMVSENVAPFSRDPINLSTSPISLHEWLEQAAADVEADAPDTALEQLDSLAAAAKQQGIDFVGCDGHAFEGLQQVATPWLTDKGRAVVVLQSVRPGSPYPGDLEVVALRDGNALQHSMELAGRLQALRREMPEQMDFAPRVHRFFLHARPGAGALRGMVAELVHSSCFQLRRGHPGGVPLAVVCPVALQAASFLSALHSKGLCHGNLSIRAMGLKVDDSLKAKLKLWEFWAEGDTIVYPAPEAVYAELRREEARNYRNRCLPVLPGWGGDLSDVDWAAADVWQLGCCLWELLTGRPAPYYGLGRGGVTLADMAGQDVKALLKQQAPEGGWNKHVLNVLSKLLDLSPRSRASAAAAHGDLQRVMAAIEQGKA